MPPLGPLLTDGVLDQVFSRSRTFLRSIMVDDCGWLLSRASGLDHFAATRSSWRALSRSQRGRRRRRRSSAFVQQQLPFRELESPVEFCLRDRLRARARTASSSADLVEAAVAE